MLEDESCSRWSTLPIALASHRSWQFSNRGDVGVKTVARGYHLHLALDQQDPGIRPLRDTTLINITHKCILTIICKTHLQDNHSTFLPGLIFRAGIRPQEQCPLIWVAHPYPPRCMHKCKRTHIEDKCPLDKCTRRLCTYRGIKWSCRQEVILIPSTLELTVNCLRQRINPFHRPYSPRKRWRNRSSTYIRRSS